MRRASWAVVAGLALLTRTAFAIDFECVGEEKGINSLTGEERVIPVSLHISIDGRKASVMELAGTKFTVKENKDTYQLKASLGGSKLRPSGQYTLQIDKTTGEFSAEIWLLSKADVSTQKGKCEPVAE